MLRLVLGRAATGKTTYVRKILADKAMAGEDVVLIVVFNSLNFKSKSSLLISLL